MLSVTLLGGTRFVADGVQVGPDLGQNGRMLACYLFEFPDRVHRREKLGDLFWTDLDPERARSALNTAIWRIRKILKFAQGGAEGGRLVTVANDVILEYGACVSVDTFKLRGAAKTAAATPVYNNGAGRDLLALEAAVECYAGPFLDGDDGDWILAEREHLHCIFVRSAVALMRECVRRKQYDRAIELGRRILAFDPLREGVQREVILLLVLNSQRAEAIFAYRKLQKLLRVELGIEPMPATRRLADDIMSGDIFGKLGELTDSYFGDGSASPLE